MALFPSFPPRSALSLIRSRRTHAASFGTPRAARYRPPRPHGTGRACPCSCRGCWRRRRASANRRARERTARRAAAASTRAATAASAAVWADSRLRATRPGRSARVTAQGVSSATVARTGARRERAGWAARAARARSRTWEGGAERAGVRPRHVVHTRHEVLGRRLAALLLLDHKEAVALRRLCAARIRRALLERVRLHERKALLAHLVRLDGRDALDRLALHHQPCLERDEALRG